MAINRMALYPIFAGPIRGDFELTMASGAALLWLAKSSLLLPITVERPGLCRAHRIEGHRFARWRQGGRG